MNTKSTTVDPSTRPTRLLDARMVQNFHLVWLNGNIDEVNNNDCRNSITKLRQIVNTVNTFIDLDECIDFITDYKEEKASMVISGEFSQIILQIVEDISEVSFIYILCENKVQCEKWAQQCSKIRGVYTDITSLCEEINQAAHDCEQNSISISIVKATAGVSNQSLDTLDSSFMYTQILKDILLTIDFKQIHFNEFVTYCREQFVDNPKELKNVDKIEEEYSHYKPVWWYTFNCFLYSMLNRALRTMEVELIIKMGFFVRDLHKHIAELHLEQYGEQHHSESFIVYRGQGLSQIDFHQLKATQGGLLAFNNFLSTSHKYDVSLKFARRTINTSSLVGVLFVIKIDPSISTTPFANVKSVSCYQKEEEILFSMNSVFRIGSVEQIEKNDRLWQVDLTLTNDNDPQLQVLTEHIQEETFSVGYGWDRLGVLLIKLGHFSKANELCQILLKQLTNEGEKGHLYHMLGMIKNGQGEYAEAAAYYEKSITIWQKIRPATDPNLGISYNNIGLVYKNMGEYSQALLSYEKAVEIAQKTLPANHPSLATSYNNIGEVYRNMGEYSQALLSYEKALEILKKTLPVNHPHLATAHNNIGGLYLNMGEHSKALSSFEKAFEMQIKSLPENHVNLANSYNNIGEVYRNVGEYSKAFSCYEKALEIFQKTLPINHPRLATPHSNIGLVYYSIGEYSKALSSLKKALEIEQKTHPANHPSLANSYNNIGEVYKKMGECSKALLSYEKALEIQQKTLPANHSLLATSYNNIGGVYYDMGEYSKALSSLEKSLEIRQKILPANHPDLATSYNNIGGVYDKMGEYSKALSFYEKALEIRQKILPGNHRSLTISYKNIGSACSHMGEYSKALSSYEKALEIEQKTLSADDPDLAITCINVGGKFLRMNDYSKALSYFERALDIFQRSLPPNHAHVKFVKESIEIIKQQL